MAQLKLQAIAVLSTLVYSSVITLILLMITKTLFGFRVDQEEERDGLFSAPTKSFSRYFMAGEAHMCLV